MSEEIVKIKGSKTGLQLEFAKEASYEQIREGLQTKLASGAGFFSRGTLVEIPYDAFSDHERADLQQLFNEYGLICYLTKELNREVVAKKSEPKETVENNEDNDNAAQQMIVVNKTLRGGQEIRTKGSVMVCGNVNPGAQIIAGGSIDIRGTCRGLVHAGAYGDNTAFIIADHLMPTQIRISNLIARSPDKMERSERAERAMIKNSQIVIEPIER